MEKKLLSVLILTLPKRKKEFDCLYSKLTNQILNSNYSSLIEVLVDDTIQIEPVKRNILVKKAEGKFLCFIDDDDDVSDSYINDIILVLKENKNIDCIGYKAYVKFNEKIYKEMVFSIKNLNYCNNVILYRPITHINVVKTKIAKKIKFDESIINGCDVEWSLKLKKHLKREKFIDKFLYIYLFNSSKKLKNFYI